MPAQTNPTEPAHAVATDGPARLAGGEALPADGTVVDIPILVYHLIDDAGPAELASYRIAPAAFKDQMQYLAAQGYSSISLADRAAAVASRRRLTGRPIVITFDHGYRNFRQHAWPILQQSGFTATLFVVTDKVGQTADWDAEKGGALPLMDWDELRQLRAQGCEIGSQSASHRSLPDLPTEEVQSEGVRARDRLRAELGIDATCIAFPWGRSNEIVRTALACAGYSVGVTNGGGFSTSRHDPLNLPRIEILPQDDLEAFAAKLRTSETLPARSASVTTLTRAVPRFSDLRAVTDEEGIAIHPEHAKKLAAQLEALMGDFVALQSQVLAAGGLGTSLQARLCKAFREPITGAVTRVLVPYEKLSSGIAIGFEAETEGRLTVEGKSRPGTSPENCSNTLRLDIKGASRYLSLEFECAWSDISAAERFQLGIYGTVSRAVLGRAFLRFPTTDGKQLDLTLAHFELGSEHRNVNRSGDVPYVDYVNIDTTKPPILIFDVDISQLPEFSWKLNYLSLYFD